MTRDPGKTPLLILTMTFIALVSAGNANADLILFVSEKGGTPSTGGSPAIGVNPTFSLPQGGTATMYVWAQLGPTETVPGLAYDVINATVGIASATSHVVDNPTVTAIRWNGINQGALGELVSGSNFVKVGGGLNGSTILASFDPTFDAATSSYRVAQIGFQATGVGATDVFLRVGSKGIASGSVGAPVHFGWGDSAVPNNAFGMTSSLADARIMVSAIPEPSAAILVIVCAVGSYVFYRFRSSSA